MALEASTEQADGLQEQILNQRGKSMGRKRNTLVGVGALTAFLLCGATSAVARGGQSQPAQQQPPAQADKDKQPNPAPLSMDNVAAPASPEEEAAFKAVQQATDPNKRTQLAEEFLQKYPQSRYRPSMYQSLVSGYFATQQVPKMLDAGEKEIEMNPNDAPVLAVMAQTLARTYNAKAPDAAKQLDKAELYSKRAIEITPTLPKPENLTDEAFNNAKNDTLVMAHGGLGLVYIRRGKYSEAIPELEQSVKADTHPDPDPVNYYLLGVADKQTSHFDAAAAAFSKCAAVPSSLQGTCKSSAEDAKKQGSTQLSAPN
jgi:tetratricopeptide (TPR) repeat protein